MDGTFVEKLEKVVRKPIVSEVDECFYLSTPEESPEGTIKWITQGGRLGWGPDGDHKDLPTPNTLLIPTLAGLVAYVHENPDHLTAEKTLVIVRSAVLVDVFGPLHEDSMQRPHYLSARMGDGHRFPYGQWMDPDTFTQEIQTRFAESDDLKDLLIWTSTMQSAATVIQSDDGVTQTISIQSGTSLCKRTPVRARLTLFPRGQTFPEIPPQPLGVIFRVLGGSETKPPACGLFSGAPCEWEAAACAELGKWLREQLGESAQVIG